MGDFKHTPGGPFLPIELPKHILIQTLGRLASGMATRDRLVERFAGRAFLPVACQHSVEPSHRGFHPKRS